MTRDLFRYFLALTMLGAVACGDDSTGSGGGTPDMGGGTPDMTVVDFGMPDADMGDAGMDTEGGMPDMDEPEMDEGACTDPGGTVGEGCFRNSDCNDFCFCNGTELCRAGRCVAGDPPCEDDFECTFRECSEEDNECGTLELQDEVCDDGNQCTGMETCDALLGCVDGIPLNCSDGDSCTIDACDPTEGCLNPLRDLDEDGFADSRCTPDGDPNADCEDTNPNVNPGTPEVCDNFVDDDCDGQADVFDADCTPTNDTCRDAIELVGSGFYGFGTTGLEDDYTTRCGSGSNRDALFFFEVTVESDFEAIVAGAPTGTVLELRGPGDFRICEDDVRAGTDMVPCDRASSTTNPADIRATRLPEGIYYIIAETPSEGVFNLEFNLTPSLPPPLTNDCMTAPTIAAPGGVFTERFPILTDVHPTPDCGGSSAQLEACYKLELTSPQDVVIEGGFFFSSGSSASGAVALVTDFTDPVGTEVACEDGAAPEITFRGLSAGIYYILAERISSSAASLELEVSITPPMPIPPCDTCMTACTASPTDMRSVDLSVMSDDHTGAIGCPASSPGVDMFFSFETTVADEAVGIEIDSPAGFYYSIDDATGTCPATTAVFCGFGGFLGSLSTTVSVPDVGTHNLAVVNSGRSGMMDVTITPSGAAAP